LTLCALSAGNIPPGCCMRSMFFTLPPYRSGQGPQSMLFSGLMCCEHLSNRLSPAGLSGQLVRFPGPSRIFFCQSSRILLYLTKEVASQSQPPALFSLLPALWGRPFRRFV
jgi:hypothetical protein